MSHRHQKHEPTPQSPGVAFTDAGRPTTSPRPGAVPVGVRRVASPAAATELAKRLLDPTRRHPVVAISIPSGREEPRIDAVEVAKAVHGLAEVILMPTDATTWHFSDAMPPMTQVYGGAGRVYPVDLAWTKDPYRSPLRFAYDEREGDRATDLLISDALGMARAAGLIAETEDADGLVTAEGTVALLVAPSRAMVRLDDGGMATIWQELTADVPLESLLTTGMTVVGAFDPGTRRLDVTGMRTGADAVEHCGPGDVVLAKVAAVRPDVVHLALHPDVVVPVQRHYVTDEQDEALTSLFTDGEVVTARVERRDGERWTLRLDDVDLDDEPLPPPPVLVGGPPWLSTPAPPQVDESEPLSAPTQGPQDAAAVTPTASSPEITSGHLAPMPKPGAVRALSLTLEAAKAEIRRLESELAEAQHVLAPLQAERDHLERTLADLRVDRQRLLEQVAGQKTQLRRSLQSARKRHRREVPTPVDEMPAFLDPIEQLRHEVYLAWATRISASEKSERPLPDYRIGSDFLASIDNTEGVSRSKVVQVIVEVLTGLAEQLNSRELHVLRTGPGGDDPPVRRQDGAVCMRVSLQRNTPSARRLHYWKNGGQIELSRVALHDDMHP